MSASATIAAIKARLVADGYDVALFRVIDPDLDALPIVGVYFGDDGQSTALDGSPVSRHELDIEVVLVDQAGDVDDAEIEALVAAEALATLLVVDRADRPESYGGACHRVEQRKLSVDTRPTQTDTIVARVQLRAFY